ncbi:uncharacterized protein LOC124165498 [Ischnura elegans]|uniref:uncharacterized protein LOC124165498 n=1 Tax=Ischnura elegans TaxID=197161 RepID=UPI001ED88237|nr:uncharacterized protein LOC124165498 [Ischnura elegans]
MRYPGRKCSRRCPLWVIYFVAISLQTSLGLASTEPLTPGSSAAQPSSDDDVERFGVGEVLIVDEFGREARSYWDTQAAEEKVETVTVYGGMEVVGGGSSNGGGPDVVKGQALKERQRDSGDDATLDSDLAGQNSIRDSAQEATLLDCVLQGDLPCIQKKAFRALQKLIQMSQPGAITGSTNGQDKFPAKEGEDGGEKAGKGVGITQSPGWWVMGAANAAPGPKPGTEGNPVDEVIKALSSNGGMSRLLEEVRDLVVDLVSNVISLQDTEEDRMRMDKRSGGDEIESKLRRRRSVVAKKSAGPLPLGLGSSVLPMRRLGEKMGIVEQDVAASRVEEPTSVQRGGSGGGGGGKKRRRNGISTILMGIMTLKSIFSYIGSIFSQILQLKQIGLSVLSFIVSVVRLIVLIRAQNHEKQPQVDTKVVYLRPQHSAGHYGEHLQPQHYGAADYYIKRSLDASSDPAQSDESAHDLAYSAQKP